MKTKKKMIALVQIAIVLCSMFLVALPVVAAQEQTMQEVSTSANTITTASEDDYVLGIYGNANEDDTIDMGDVVYTKLAIFGKKPKTELCDAKYDGRINVLDVIQTKLIILGKEKELTIVGGDPITPVPGEDDYGKAVTVHKPVKRIVATGYSSAEVLRALNAENEVVGVCNYIKGETLLFPELSKLPSVGNWGYPDYEAILTLHPDVLMPLFSIPEYEEKLPGVTIISLDLYTSWKIPGNVMKVGYILDKREEAEEFIDWYNGYMDMIKSRTEGLPEDEKRKVMLEWGNDYSVGGKNNQYNTLCVIAGGSDIGADLPSGSKVDPEWVIVQNPDIITKTVSAPKTPCGYNVDDLSGMKAKREEIMNRAGFAHVNAVKYGRVYIIDFRTFMWGPSIVVCAAYMARWFNPELFEDLDPQTIHQEYLDRFQRIGYDLDTHGVFVYPEEPV